MPQLFLIIRLNLIQEQRNVSFLDILLELKGMRFLICQLMLFNETIFPYVNGGSDFTNPFTTVSEVVDNSPDNNIANSFVTPISILEAPIHSHNPFSSPFELHSHEFGTNKTDFVSNEIAISPSTSFTPPIPTPPSSPMPIPALPLTKKSFRIHKTPAYLQDYACNSTASSHTPGSPYDIADYLTYSHLHPPYQSYPMTISACHQEPASFFQAV